MPPSTRQVIGVDDDEDGRYHRQTLISWWDQDRLANASVLVIGAGALGNELAKNLALIGVGHIAIADLDRVENSNLARCVFFREGDEGKPKAAVLAERVRELNPEVRTVGVMGDVRTSVGLAVFAEVDLVLAGLDNREARMFVNQACFKTSTPWVDGAIEGLMGVVRVFTPPHGACYECTLSAADRQLIARRRACSLLSRDEMLDGKVPTTATTSSVVAGIEAQEAVKLLHTDRLAGGSDLAGAGYQFVGISNDSYRVRYKRRDDCLAHDTYGMSEAEEIDPDSTFAEILEEAQTALGPNAVIELEHDIAIGASCQSCGACGTLLQPMPSLTAGSGVCSGCGREWRIDFAHTIGPGSQLERLTPKEIGLPPADVVTGRVGDQRVHFRLTGGRPGLDCLRSGGLDD